MSSFRRKISSQSGGNACISVNPHDPLPGTKPFLNGQTLVSSGLSQLDTILGGGFLLEQLILVETSRHSLGSGSFSLMNDLHRYFIAEGIASKQLCLIVSEDTDEFLDTQLPLELSSAQKQMKEQMEREKKKKEQQQQDGEHLKIAWQYSKYLNESQKKERFCHSFDLSKCMQRDLLHETPPIILDLNQYFESTSTTSNDLWLVYEQLLGDIEEHLNTSQQETRNVTRISIQNFGTNELGTCFDSLLRFLRRLKALLHGHAVLCMIDVPLYTFSEGFGNEIRHLCDYVFEMSSFMGENDMLPDELCEFCGLFQIRKLPRIHSLACHSLETTKYGIKRERRKLKIEKLHLPPQGSRSTETKTIMTTRKSCQISYSTGSSNNGSNVSTSLDNPFDPLDF